MISDTPQDREAGNLRVHQAQEVAAAYGVPPPLIGMVVTEWGQGIAELARMFYRFGAKQHAERFLAPFQTRLLRPGDRFPYRSDRSAARQHRTRSASSLMAVQGDAQRTPIATLTELRRIAGLTADPGGRVRAAARPAGRHGRSEGELDAGQRNRGTLRVHDPRRATRARAAPVHGPAGNQRGRGTAMGAPVRRGSSGQGRRSAALRSDCRRHGSGVHERSDGVRHDGLCPDGTCPPQRDRGRRDRENQHPWEGAGSRRRPSMRLLSSGGTPATTCAR